MKKEIKCGIGFGLVGVENHGNYDEGNSGEVGRICTTLTTTLLKMREVPQLFNLVIWLLSQGYGTKCTP